MSGKNVVRCFFGAALGMAAVSAWSATPFQIDTARNHGLLWLFTHQTGEGAWGSAQNTTVADTASVLDALGVAGVRGPLFSRGYSWLSNAEADSVDSLTRQIAAVAAAGGDTSRLIAKLSSWRNSQLGWGAYYRYDSSFPDTALAVIAGVDC